jgi:hypothetical protein
LQNLHRENYPPVGGIATARARDFVMPRLGDALKAESIPDAWRSQPLPSERAKKTFWSAVTLRIQHFGSVEKPLIAFYGASSALALQRDYRR